MNPQSKAARDRLKLATRAEFEHLVYEAMLQPFQEKIVRLHISGSPEAVREGRGF